MWSFVYFWFGCVSVLFCASVARRNCRLCLRRCIILVWERDSPYCNSSRSSKRWAESPFHTLLVPDGLEMLTVWFVMLGGPCVSWSGSPNITLRQCVSVFIADLQPGDRARRISPPTAPNFWGSNKHRGTFWDTRSTHWGHCLHVCENGSCWAWTRLESKVHFGTNV